jgi:hypothetical protein
MLAFPSRQSTLQGGRYKPCPKGILVIPTSYNSHAPDLFDQQPPIRGNSPFFAKVLRREISVRKGAINPQEASAAYYPLDILPGD